ncbi:UDP-N-acetyl-D-mannosaminuronic acid dehydrogenase [Halogeometricum pallidum JCM 14848]|uniref:UDP-N-acetyl-D-mannosamine dehydrogenase n=1 Tax=Halogeometricum pallidum JCM 14848 TaxID=1227487 RepID=M0D9Z5_HALPD|nr:nucleotide sugar dehydrogenase [Halogeometricum pallidum]ELZ31633.1 UDP-N-acetyl-D-mannosaminuronic acid dehydrogenase [Halogeometricum pallidum JCM 14848]
MGLYDSQRDPDEQRRAFTSGEVPVSVVGLGKMGLPLAAVYAETAGEVIGVDVDQGVVDGINEGRSHIKGEPGLSDLVAEQVEAGRLRATTSAAEAAEAAAVHVVIVPTPLTDDHEPDLGALTAAVEGIGEGLSKGDLVVVECTVPPGTCEGRVRPLLSSVSGLDEDEFGVAFCPERTSSGRALKDIRGAYPKVVGGADEESGRAAELIYGELTSNDIVPMADATSAEAVKLFEGVYRDVNIALANELAKLDRDLGIDVNEAIDAANTQPFCDIHTPGPGVGGHCIPFYPYFIMKYTETDTPLLRTAREVNDSMPAHTVHLLADGLEAMGRDVDGSTVAVLGITYRAGVEETRKTPAAGVIDGLNARGAKVLAADPLIDDIESFGATPVDAADIPDEDVDAVVLVTAHEEFADIDWGRLEDALLVDGRGVLEEWCGEGDYRILTIGGGERVSGQ